jgi:hypothetical protein
MTTVGLSTAPISAQTAWDAPAFISHVAPEGASIFLISPHGGDIGGLLTFRHEAGPVGLGYRASLSDENGGDGIAIAGGIDISGFLSRGVNDAPFDVLWWSGVGFGIGDSSVISLPLGAIIGWTGSGDGVSFNPYAGAHATLDFFSGNGSNDADLGASFDMGVDLVLTSGWIVRFGGSVGDREAFAIGVRLNP